LVNVSIEIPLISESQNIIDIARSVYLFSEIDITCIKDLVSEYFSHSEERDEYHFLVAKVNKLIQGFICFGHRPLTTGTFDIYWVAVSPNFQKIGLGKELLSAAEEQIIKLKGYLVLIETSGSKEFIKTRAFYQSAGYKITAEIPDFYNKNDSLVIYSKRV